MSAVMCIGYITAFVPIKIADSSQDGSQDTSDVDWLLKPNAGGMTVKNEMRTNGFQLRSHALLNRPIFTDLYWHLVFSVLSIIKSSLTTQYHFQYGTQAKMWSNMAFHFRFVLVSTNHVVDLEALISQHLLCQQQ